LRFRNVQRVNSNNRKNDVKKERGGARGNFQSRPLRGHAGARWDQGEGTPQAAKKGRCVMKKKEYKEGKGCHVCGDREILSRKGSTGQKGKNRAWERGKKGCGRIFMGKQKPELKPGRPSKKQGNLGGENKGSNLKLDVKKGHNRRFAQAKFEKKGGWGQQGVSGEGGGAMVATC